jgi:hypothetical protein
MLFPLVAANGYRVTLVGLADNIKSDMFKGVRLMKAPRSQFMKTDKLLYYVAAIFMAMRLRPRIVHFQGLGSALFLWAYKLMGAKTVVRYGSADYLVGKWGCSAARFPSERIPAAFCRCGDCGDAALADRLARQDQAQRPCYRERRRPSASERQHEHSSG